MPARVRAHLGLGDAPCWIVTSELNQFTWPGPDIRPIPRSDGMSPRYGSIPGKLFDQLRQKLEAAVNAGGLKVTKRTE